MLVFKLDNRTRVLTSSIGFGPLKLTDVALVIRELLLVKYANWYIPSTFPNLGHSALAMTEDPYPVKKPFGDTG